jgi:hypothetical protein
MAGRTRKLPFLIGAAEVKEKEDGEEATAKEIESSPSLELMKDLNPQTHEAQNIGSKTQHAHIHTYAHIHIRAHMHTRAHTHPWVRDNEL